METNNFSKEILKDIDFFLDKNEIHINNIEHIIYILKEAKEKILTKSIINNINSLITELEIFSDNIEDIYFENIKILKEFLNKNYNSWLIDQIDDKNIIKEIEFFIDFEIKNIKKDYFEKLNNSIKIINIFFSINEYAFLSDEERESIYELNEYIKNPNLKDYENIKILLEDIKNNCTNDKSDNITKEKKEIKEEVEEQLDLHLPDIMNNLYVYFSKLFDRKRKTIEHSEIISLQHILIASSNFLEKHKEIYGELIFEQFQNLENNIKELDTENIREFNEVEVKEHFENLIFILKEISNIHKKKKIEA